MSNVHIQFHEDSNGDLVDITYYHHSCSPADVLGWPAPESVDYPVYCGHCTERIHEVPLATDALHGKYMAADERIERLARIAEVYPLAAAEAQFYDDNKLFV